MKITKFKIRHVNPEKEIHVIVYKEAYNRKIGISCGMMEYIHPKDRLKWHFNTWIELLFGVFGDDFLPQKWK